MTEAQWLASEDPRAMMQAHPARPGGFGGLNDRKLRLWVEACRAAETTINPQAEYLYDGAPQYDLTTVSGLWAAVMVWTEAIDHDTIPTRAHRAALLRDVVGNPFRTPEDYAHCEKCGCWFVPATSRPHRCPRCGSRGPFTCARLPGDWLTPTVLSLARAACEDKKLLPDRTIDPLRLAVLADGLEEAGCQKESLMRHLRGEEPCPCDSWPDWCTGWRPLRGPHVRGCWALNLILGEK